ncbi:MAG: histidinol dehydrogenase [Acidobacteriota bacterium]
MSTASFSIRQIHLDSMAAIVPALAFSRPRHESGVAVSQTVAATIAAVRERGDDAVIDEVRRFDWPCPDPAHLRVTASALRDALDAAPPDLRSAMTQAAASIRTFHERQVPAGASELVAAGSRAGLRAIPVASAGLYVPGGRAAYPSTLLMLAIPARIANVPRIAVCSPAGEDGLPAPAVLAAASLLGIDEVYGIGGAAAVAALAHGTATIPRVAKVFGPGNAWVAEAKRQVFGTTGVEAIAGPTELVVLSDGSAPARWIAADLLAQAEHDVEASAILLTTDRAEPARVLAEISREIEGSPRAAVQRESLARRGAVVTCARPEIACAAAAELAPEHLSVMTREPEAWAADVPTAAAVFLGPFAPEAAGDYGAGPNHSLPTGGSARFASPVGVWDFVRLQSYLELDRAALARMRPWMETLAMAEGLAGHARSLAVRDEEAP